AVDIVKSVRPLFLTLILGEEHTELLARQREELSDDITELVNELGPKIYPEFSNTRVPVDVLLGDGKKTHDNIINGSADAFHRKMREGEQALRQRMGGGGSSSNLRQDAEDASSTSGLRQRRPSKYSFSPPTPRTMATLNSISPLEFLTSVAPPQTAQHPPPLHSMGDSPDCDEVETMELPADAPNTETAQVAPSAVSRTSAAASTQQQQYQGGTPATTDEYEIGVRVDGQFKKFELDTYLDMELEKLAGYIKVLGDEDNTEETMSFIRHKSIIVRLLNGILGIQVKTVVDQ
ncbi:Glycerol-3-phosphate/dihydroxyacetone phosphate acyltransferase, partial [Coemansia sp. RSA 2531]